jgi:hypothetical protein
MRSARRTLVEPPRTLPGVSVGEVAAVLAIAAGSAAVAASGGGSDAPGASIGCPQSLNPMNPGIGSPTATQRLVLGRVWQPKATLLLGRHAWRHVRPGENAFIKYGVGVTSGPPVTLVVPLASSETYALSFHGVRQEGVRSLRLTPCPRSSGATTFWAGGYRIARATCVPLVVRVGSRSARVRIALGHAC